MVCEGEQRCASPYLRHVMRADHIVHRRVVFFASKQGFAAGSRFRRYDIHFSIPTFPTQREFSSHRQQARGHALQDAPADWQLPITSDKDEAAGKFIDIFLAELVADLRIESSIGGIDPLPPR